MSASSEIESEKEKTAFDIIKNWFLNSPTHGIRRISRASSIPGRLFWSTTLLIFTTLMCIFIYTVIMKYIANPTKISLSVRQYREAKYIPTVTFCNLNPIRNDNFLREDTHNPTSTCTDEECQARFTDYMNEILTGNLNNTQPTIAKSGYKLDDLLIQCTFNGQTCNNNFTSFFHPNYGNCYTFNNIDSMEDIEENEYKNVLAIDDENDDDDTYKLFLELYLYQSEYISYLDERAAFRLFIHRKNEIPILSENSLLLPPTTFTKLIYSQRLITFSQKCRKDLTDDMKQIFDSNSVRYSQALCYKLCEFRFIEKRCRCADYVFMIFLQFFTPNRTLHINTTKSCPATSNCFKFRAHFNSRQHCPECSPECELIQYTIQSSAADYPNTRSTDKVLQRVERHLQKIGYAPRLSNISTCVNNRKAILLDDIVAVEISASPYATEILTESPMYTWVDLISSIGGQTGLWIGVSLISFVEITELLFLLFCHFIKKIYRNIFNHQDFETKL